MAALKRLAGLYLLVVGVAVTLHFLATQFYDPTWSDASLPVWQVLNPLQIIGVIIVLLVAFERKRAVSDDSNDTPVSREYFEANVLFYAAAAVLIAHLWNWFGVQFSDPVNSNNQLWIYIDIALALLFIPTAISLLRKQSD
ncbi:MAG: hypothetical protein OXM03_07720 [Chloroflexota bacterium]|nr:hypothetical protein [Chloroflexota bacterium]MDE2840501.1 hypothetical protein [Chloroflexota bacterium]MDE2932193.1 hypothetical protein [Chloroflexota bacterium]